MAYSKQSWADGSSGGTPLSASRLQHMEDGIAAAVTVDGGGGAVGQVVAVAQASPLTFELADQTGGGGAVESVNGQTGVVTLDAADVGADAAGAAAALVPTLLRPPSRPSRGAQTMVSAFQTGHGWTGNATGTINLNDTSDFALGSQCVSIVTSGGGNVGGQRSEITKSAIPTFDMTAKTLRLWVKLVNSTNLDMVRVGVGTDASNYFLIDAVFPAAHLNGLVPDGQWAVVDFDLAGAAAIGTPNRAACTFIMLRVTDKGGTTASVRFGGVALVDKPPASRYPNGVITIGFDDGYIDQFTNARAKMDTYGFPATCYIIQDLIGANPGATYMGLNQLRELEDMSGWEIAAHAATAANHNAAGAFTSLTEAQLRAELEPHKTWMVENGFRGVDHFAYPQGAWSAATVSVVREYFATARTTTPPGYGSPTPAESQRMRVSPINAGTTAATLNGLVDQVKTNRGWLQVYTHRVLASGAVGTQIEQATFNTFIDYIATQGVAVRTVGEVLAGV